MTSQWMQKKVFDTVEHPFIKKKNGGGVFLAKTEIEGNLFHPILFFAAPSSFQEFSSLTRD